MDFNWEAIGAVGEIIGALAVVFSLLFLGFQLRQNTQSIRRSTRAHVTETVADTLAVMQGAEFAEVVTQGFASYRQLPPREQLRFASFMLRMLRVWEDAYFQWRAGDYDDGAWRSNRAFMLDILSLNGANEFFYLRTSWFDARFVEYVQSELSGYEPEVRPEYVASGAPPDA